MLEGFSTLVPQIGLLSKRLQCLQAFITPRSVLKNCVSYADISSKSSLLEMVLLTQDHNSFGMMWFCLDWQRAEVALLSHFASPVPCCCS